MLFEVSLIASPPVFVGRSEQGAAGQAISEGGQAHGAACQQLYDRVLVDAECTHDGSIKHIAKFREGGWGQFEAK
jgi:hypothetical protein